jgi:hypothetical protein
MPLLAIGRAVDEIHNDKSEKGDEREASCISGLRIVPSGAQRTAVEDLRRFSRRSRTLLPAIPARKAFFASVSVREATDTYRQSWHR